MWMFEYLWVMAPCPLTLFELCCAAAGPTTQRLLFGRISHVVFTGQQVHQQIVSWTITGTT
jgi:hypothetical protein